MDVKRVEVGDGCVEVRVIDAATTSRQRMSLVFLHEGLGSVSLWRDFPDLVAARTGMRAIVYSRRGYGASDSIALPRPSRFMHDEAAGYLPRLLSLLAPDDDHILIGHSDGASIALLYAASRPAKLRGVVAIAPHVFVEDVSVASIAKARDAYNDPSTLLRARLEKHHGANVDVAFRGWNDVWLSDEFRSWNIERDVEKINVPILVIQGRDDEYGTLAQVESIRAHATHSQEAQIVILDHCGHSPHRDQPEASIAAIAGFVMDTIRS